MTQTEEWCTPLENTFHAIKNGRMQKAYSEKCKPVVCNETDEVYKSLEDAGYAYGIGGENIARQIKGVTKKAGGHTWRWLNA